MKLISLVYLDADNKEALNRLDRTDAVDDRILKLLPSDRSRFHGNGVLGSDEVQELRK